MPEPQPSRKRLVQFEELSISERTSRKEAVAFSHAHNRPKQIGDKRTEVRQLQDSLVKEKLRQVYSQSRLYHGTGYSSKQAIKRTGFDANEKRTGATARRMQTPEEKKIWAEAIATASRHNYFTSWKRLATGYAKFGSPKNPAIVRTIGTQPDVKYEHDPDSQAGRMRDSSFRTSDIVPAYYVLGSKKSKPGVDGVVFHRELKRAGVDVSLDQAGRLLREVQSDSEDDFS
ncbi:hypothetical protein DFQ30_004663, partial [Apophysomyces sp. BC1015]